MLGHLEEELLYNYSLLANNGVGIHQFVIRANRTAYNVSFANDMGRHGVNILMKPSSAVVYSY